jgi:hypothetical protein
MIGNPFWTTQESLLVTRLLIHIIFLSFKKLLIPNNYSLITLFRSPLSI